jgi:hypothetical protein
MDLFMERVLAVALVLCALLGVSLGGIAVWHLLVNGVC